MHRGVEILRVSHETEKGWGSVLIVPADFELDPRGRCPPQQTLSLSVT